jgi:hypothetical protein
MQHTKLAKGRGHNLPIRDLSPALRDQTEAARSAGKKTDHKKAARKEVQSAQPLRKELGGESKSDKLVCRYCGSDDLAPSFIKRRDRRCRECFSKRYGSAARARKAKVQK